MERTALRRALATDRLLQAILFVYGGLFLLYLAPDGGTNWSAIREQTATYFWDGFFLILTLSAIQFRLQSDHSEHGVRFWNTICAALIFWFLADSVKLLPVPDSIAVRVSVLSNCLYAAYYLLLVLASREYPDPIRSAEDRKENVHAWMSLLFVFAFLVYFSVIPAWNAPALYASWDRIFFLFYVCLDLYVAARFVHLFGISRTRKWRLVYGVLIFYSLSSALLAGMRMYAYDGDKLIPNYHGTPWDLVWHVPFFLTALVARWERGIPEDEPVPEDEIRTDAPAWEPIAFYAVTFPLVHLLLDAYGLIDPETAAARRATVILYFLFFGTVALIESWRREQQRARAISQLRKSEERFRRVVENIPEIILIESEGRLIFTNSNALDKLGEHRLSGGAAEALDLEDHDFSTPNKVPILKRLEQPHGLYLDLEITWASVDFEGKPATQLTARDVTSLRRMQRETERLEHLAALGKFSSAMAHKIRNPLAAIVMQSSFLSRRLDGEPAYQEILTDLQSSVNRLQNLVKAVQSFIRPPKIQIESAEITEIIASAVQAIEMDASKVELVEDFEHSDGTIEVDAYLIKIVLVNLLHNSIRAMPSGGLLSIKTSSQRGFLKLTIEDAGDGISQEDMSRIFEPFFSRRDDGVGLGLALTEQILSQHDCRYMMESDVGVGSRFSIWFRTPTPEHHSSEESPSENLSSEEPSAENPS